jgi:SAM-dependent methyltransferase
MREYEVIADWYRTARGQTVDVAEALAVAATVAAGSCLLDIRCGNGVPITEALAKAGRRVVRLDTSTGMLTRFRMNLPGTPVVRGDARNCPFANGSFDAAISQGMMFHLPRADQSNMAEVGMAAATAGVCLRKRQAEPRAATDRRPVVTGSGILPRRDAEMKSLIPGQSAL